MSTPQEITDQTVATSLIGTDYIIGIDRSDTTQGADGSMCLITRDNLGLGLSIAASQVNSGTLADARIAESNVTQHQAALSITESQISDIGPYLSLAGGTLTGTLNLPSDGLAVGTDQLVFNNGNVGFGIDPSSDKLEVDGSCRLAGRGTSYAFKNPDFRIYNTSSGNDLVIDDYVSTILRVFNAAGVAINGDSYLGSLTVYGHSAADEACVIQPHASTTGDQIVFDLQTPGGSATILTAQAGGNVGLGTNSPTETLDVNGTLRVRNLPTSDPAQAGEFWNDSGTVKVSAG